MARFDGRSSSALKKSNILEAASASSQWWQDGGSVNASASWVESSVSGVQTVGAKGVGVRWVIN